MEVGLEPTDSAWDVDRWRVLPVPRGGLVAVDPLSAVMALSRDADRLRPPVLVRALARRPGAGSGTVSGIGGPAVADAAVGDDGTLA
jgi:hypothetical protein